MRFSEEILKQRLEQVPQNIYELATSNDVAETLASIAREHDLHIDQAGILDEETLYVMLGLEDTEKFVDGIRERIGLPGEEASAIANEVNQKIFLSIRDLLKKGEAPKNLNTDPSKEDILNEIENPTPVEHPISIAKEIPAFPIPREIIQEKPPERTGEAITHDFIAEKLAGTVSLPSQKTVAEPEKLPEKPKSYAADPYRESLT